MEHVGYSLIQDGKEIQFWGDTQGVSQGVPDVISLPNGDRVHCPEVGVEYGGCKLVPRMVAVGEKNSTQFDGESVNVYRPAPPELTLDEKLRRIGLTREDILEIVKGA